MFGGNCSIIGGDHFFAEPSENMRFTNLLGENKGLVIEADAWIGHGTTILKNGNIGEGAIIGSHSLVTKPIKPYSVNVGHPAKFLYPRFKTFEDLCRYLDMMEEKYFFKSKHSKESLKALLYDRATK
jgi:acetyltransferase-like isoleucine patch superfamily enzyme